MPDLVLRAAKHRCGSSRAIASHHGDVRHLRILAIALRSLKAGIRPNRRVFVRRAA
jgi:hypothetical protein